MPYRWNEFAAIRRDQIEAGLDITFSRVFIPYFVELLSRRKPKSLLEVGGGTGHLAKELAGHCRNYVMLEPSRGMYDIALTTLDNTHVRVRNYSIEEFAGDEKFECVLSHLCIQVIDDMPRFIRAMASRLSDGGVLVASLPHPAFYNDYKRFFPKGAFQYMKEVGALVSFTVTLDPNRPIEGVPYHHRPVSSYVSACSEAGLCISEFSEIMPSAEVEALYGAPWETPRYLVFSARSCRGG